ncbi:MAG: hypothetical protein ACO2PQ_00150, partial [Thermoflexus sp.]
NVVKGNPGKGSETSREIEEPFQKEVTLNPEIEVWEIGIRHTRTIETGEQEGSCPSTPPYIEAWSWLGFDAENSEPWDPYKAGIFKWEEHSKTGEYEYRAPRSLNDAPSLGAFKPSDPRLVHRYYEEDPREPERNLEKYGVPLIMRFADPISQLSLISFAFVITFAAADAVTMWLGGKSLGLAGVASIVAGKLGGGMKLPSPFSLCRYPFFGKDMGKQAMKKLEDRIWRDVRWKLKQREWEAKNKGDLATLKTIHDFYDIDRKVRRAQTVKRLANALGGRSTWWALNKLSGGRLERRVDNLERRRLEILSRIMPDEAVALQQLSRMKQEKRLTREEAWQILSMTKDQAKAQLKWAWPLAFLGLMVHTEGRTTLKSLLFGRFGGKAPAAWATFGYKMPMAQEKLGINWIKVGEREDGGRRKPIGVPFPGMKARLLGPGRVGAQRPLPPKQLQDPQRHRPDPPPPPAHPSPPRLRPVRADDERPDGLGLRRINGLREDVLQAEAGQQLPPPPQGQPEEGRHVLRRPRRDGVGIPGRKRSRIPDPDPPAGFRLVDDRKDEPRRLPALQPDSQPLERLLALHRAAQGPGSAREIPIHVDQDRVVRIPGGHRRVGEEELLDPPAAGVVVGLEIAHPLVDDHPDGGHFHPGGPEPGDGKHFVLHRGLGEVRVGDQGAGEIPGQPLVDAGGIDPLRRLGQLDGLAGLRVPQPRLEGDQ